MRPGKHIYHVYIMTNEYNTTLYVGMTGKGFYRTEQHIQKVFEGFTKKYNLTKLVYFEEFAEVWDAIHREKQLKRWSRKKKEWLIESQNPDWEDLYEKFLNHWRLFHK